jgi:hypothetical protein
MATRSVRTQAINGFVPLLTQFNQAPSATTLNSLLDYLVVTKIIKKEGDVITFPVKFNPINNEIVNPGDIGITPKPIGNETFDAMKARVAEAKPLQQLNYVLEGGDYMYNKAHKYYGLFKDFVIIPGNGFHDLLYSKCKAGILVKSVKDPYICKIADQFKNHYEKPPTSMVGKTLSFLRGGRRKTKRAKKTKGSKKSRTKKARRKA